MAGARAAWRHTFQNLPDATMNARDEPLDFSLKKRIKTDPALAPPEEPLLRSCLSGRSAFDLVPPSRPAPISLSPFLASLLRSAPADTQTSRNVRPFKAYNPADPTSALSIGCLGGGMSILAGNTTTDLSIFRDLGSIAQPAAAPLLSNQHPRSHSVPSQGSHTKSNEVTSSTATPPESNSSKNTESGRSSDAIDLSPRSGNYDSSNSPSSTSVIGQKREATPPPRSATPPSAPIFSGTPGIYHLPAPAPRTRRRGQSMPDELKDDTYWERRRKNNEAAKRSRDTRRAKEDEIAMRAAYLEQENIKLKIEVAALRAETDKLRHLLLKN